MNSVLIRPGQSLTDIAIQEHGTQQSVFDFAKENKLSITEIITPGEELDKVEVDDEWMQYYYQTKSLYPTSLGFNS